MPDDSREVRERLLKAWRGEIVAGSVYELITQRMPDRGHPAPDGAGGGRASTPAGLEMTLAGVIVGGATYIVGLALPG